MSNATTTKNGFRVEDITYKGARRQSEILKELDGDSIVDSPRVEVPDSLTVEQVEKFLLGLILSSDSQQEQKIYKHLIKIQRDCEEMRKQLAVVNLKASRQLELDNQDRIMEDGVESET